MPPHLQYKILNDVYQNLPHLYDHELLTIIHDYSKSVREKYKNKKVLYIDKYEVAHEAKITNTTCSLHDIILDIQYKDTRNVYLEDVIYLRDVMIYE